MLHCYLVDLPSCEEKISRLFSLQEYPICIIKTQGIFELISEKIHSAGQNSSNLTPPKIIQSKVLAQVTRKKKILSLDDKAGSRYMCLKVLVPPPAFHHSLHLHRLTLIGKTLQPCCVQAEMQLSTCHFLLLTCALTGWMFFLVLSLIWYWQTFHLRWDCIRTLGAASHYK